MRINLNKFDLIKVNTIYQKIFGPMKIITSYFVLIRVLEKFLN